MKEMSLSAYQDLQRDRLVRVKKAHFTVEQYIRNGIATKGVRIPVADGIDHPTEIGMTTDLGFGTHNMERGIEKTLQPGIEVNLQDHMAANGDY